MSSFPADCDPPPDTSGEDTDTVDDADMVPYSQSNQYRSLRHQPTSEAATPSPTANNGSQLPGLNHPDRTRRGRTGDAIHFFNAATDPGFLRSSSVRSDGPTEPLHAPLRAHLLAGGSDPGSLSTRGTPELFKPSRLSAAHGHYFPFRHSRGRVPVQHEAPLAPFLLGLPMEVRYRIYKLLLVDPETLELNTKKSSPRFRVHPLLHVNKQLREEASQVWYGLNKFSLTIRHGETAIVREFLAAIANLESPTIGRLDINLSTCFQCNDLIAVAAVLIASNIAATIKCIRGVYHFGHPRVQPCKLNTVQAIADQNFRPSVATALLQCSDQRRIGAGFVIEESQAESFATVEPGPREASVLGYTPIYRVNPSIRTYLENAMGSVSLLLG